MAAHGSKIADAKARTRRQVAVALTGMSPSRRRAASVAIAQRLTGLPAVAQADTIMVFLSLRTEVDTWPIIQWAWRTGKRTAIPRIASGPEETGPARSKRNMVAVLLNPAPVDDVEAHPALRPGPFGILTAPDADVVPPEEIHVVLVPCQAVDRQGNRLGRGGGFYDGFLSQPGLRARRIAVAFREQVLDAVPVGAGDEPLDMVVTEGEVLRFYR